MAPNEPRGFGQGEREQNGPRDMAKWARVGSGPPSDTASFMVIDLAVRKIANGTQKWKADDRKLGCRREP